MRLALDWDLFVHSVQTLRCCLLTFFLLTVRTVYRYCILSFRRCGPCSVQDDRTGGCFGCTRGVVHGHGWWWQERAYPSVPREVINTSTRVRTCTRTYSILVCIGLRLPGVNVNAGWFSQNCLAHPLKINKPNCEKSGCARLNDCSEQ